MADTPAFKREFWPTVLDTFEGGIALFDPDGRLLHWNAWLAERSGARGLNGRRLEEAFPHLVGGRLCRALGSALNLGQASVLSPALNHRLLPLRHPALDGTGQEDLEQLVTLRPFRGPDGLRYCLMQVLDVTPVVRRERQLRRQARETNHLAEAHRANEAQVRAILDGAPLGIMVMDGHGVIDVFNPAAARMFGSPASEAVGGYASRYLKDIASLLRQPPSEPVETTGKRPDGGTFPVGVSIDRVAHEGAGRFVCIVEDISRRQHMETVLRQARDEMEARVKERTLELVIEVAERRRAEEELRKLSRAVEQSPAAVMITDTAGRIEYVNPCFERMTGYTAEEVRDRNPRFLKTGEVVDDRYGDLWRTIAAGETWHGEMRNRRKDGREIWIAASISPLRDAEGQITHFIGVEEDITERKAADDALLAAKVQAEAASHAKSEFLANMSHELRTPLHAILSYARLGQERIDSGNRDDLVRSLARIRISGNRLLALLNDLLDLSKLEAGRVIFDMGLVDLGHLVQGATEDFRAFAVERELVLQFEHSPRPLPVRADERRFGQVVQNLLSNAIRYSPPGGRITVRLSPGTLARPGRRRAGKAVILSVADQGVGIPESERETIFEKFVQGSATKTGAGGTGLGLAISRQIVEAHQGRIWVEANPGGGSVFRIALPAAPVQRKRPPVHE